MGYCLDHMGKPQKRPHAGSSSCDSKMRVPLVALSSHQTSNDSVGLTSAVAVRCRDR
jgi:hypothetical protein